MGHPTKRQRRIQLGHLPPGVDAPVWARSYNVAVTSPENGAEMRIMVIFRCHNPLCSVFETPLEYPMTRTALREMCQPDSTDKFMCVRCGEMFPLTDREKENSLGMLDEAAARA